MRYARALSYINRLLSSGDKRGFFAGRVLLKAYETWTSSLSINDFLRFLQLIQGDLKEHILVSLKGMAQTIGQFRAFSFEEFVIDLVESKLENLNKSYEVFWNEKLPIWYSSSNKVYEASFDVIIGRRFNGNISPLIVVEVKVDVDAPRLKTALFNFILLRRIFRNVKTALVYINWNADEFLIDLAEEFLDEIFHFNSDFEVKRFLDFIELNL